MLFIIMPSSKEAVSLISYFRLTLRETVPFSLYENRDTVLCVTVEAQDAVCFLDERYALARNSDNWLAYVSGCGPGTVLYAHTLVDETGHAFYPDMLYRHPFSEGEWRDAQAAAVYRAALPLLKAHKIVILKTLPLSPEAQSLPETSVSQIAVWLEAVRETLSRVPNRFQVFTLEEAGKIAEAVEKLRLTHTQKLMLEKDGAGCKARGGDVMGIITALIPATCQTKQEGKNAFVRLRQALME